MAPFSEEMVPVGARPGAAPGVHFGVAGWSYADWNGLVYPRGLAPAGQLEYLSGFVDMIEINSSFYRPPAARSAAAWVEKTASHPGFFFTAKVHQDVTHGGRLDPALVASFLNGFAPLASAGKLRGLLAQFRYDFSDSPRSRSHLEAVKSAFGGLASMIFELRHNSWQAPSALDFLETLGVTVANLDYPTARDSFTLRDCRIGPTGYFRLHGRNRKAWFDRNAGRDATYDYLYSPEELLEIKDRTIDIGKHFRSLTIVANNHFRGKEVANILELKSLLTGAPLPVPPGLLEEYPRLRQIAATQLPDL